jgi:hypothetical protein
MKARVQIFSMIFLGTALITISCRKSTTALLPPGSLYPVTGKVSKIDYANGMYDSLYYNEVGALTKVVYHEALPSAADGVFVLDYDVAGKLERVRYLNGAWFSYLDGNWYDYQYVNGRLASIDHYAKGIKRDFNVYSYLDGKISKIDAYLWTTTNTPGFELVAIDELTYYPDGNLKQDVSYFIDRQTHLRKRSATIDYVNYDDKSNVTDFLTNFPYLIEQSKNNPGKITINNEIDRIVDEFNFSYTYNSLSNPVSRVLSYLRNGQLYSETAWYHYY